MVVAELHAQKPVVVLAEGKAIVFTATDGKVTQRTSLSVEVGAVAFSPASGRLVIQTKGEWGGKLYLVDPKTGNLHGLLPQPIYFKKLTAKDKEVPASERERINREEHEVYADPEFDPTGNLLVFAVHDSGPGAWDAVEAAGPLAVLDLQSSAVRVLDATLLKKEQGPFYSNDPHWSPDGKRILLSFEAGAAIVDAKGLNITDLDGWFDQPEGAQSYADCWLDNRTIVYGVYVSAPGDKPDHFAALDLETHHSGQIAEVLGLCPGSIRRCPVHRGLCFVDLDWPRGWSRLYDRKTGQLLSSHPVKDEPAVLIEP